jgi:uncharacterized membrane protein
MNEKEETSKEQDLRNILFAIGLIMGFIFIVSLAIYMIRENYGIDCSCKLSISIAIAGLTSLGVFVGILTYYFLSKSYSKEKKKIIGNIEKTLKFLEGEERMIVKALIAHKGEITQNVLSNVTKIDAVKLHRRLVSLEGKGIISKKKNGMTNKVILEEEFREIFV